MLLELLNEYNPNSELEREFKARMLEFLNSGENCFERSNLKRHFTASGLLISRDGQKALLMHHAKLNLWLQMGGHCDGDSDVKYVAIKEAQEESGIMSIDLAWPEIFDVDIHTIPEFKGIPEHDHYDVRFLLRVTSDEDFVQNRESKELRWFGKEDELPTASESVLRMFNKWKAM